MTIVPFYFSNWLHFIALRLTVGPDKGGYYHELFLRGRVDLVGMIQRVKVKGTGVRAKANPEEEPNLYLYSAMDRDTARIIEMATSDPETSPTSVAVPLPPQLLCSTMMMVPRDYDTVQDALERDADRLLAIQKSILPVKNRFVIDQITSEVLDNESGYDKHPADINFDRLIDEMFRHDQSLDFADLLKLAAV